MNYFSDSELQEIKLYLNEEKTKNVPRYAIFEQLGSKGSNNPNYCIYDVKDGIVRETGINKAKAHLILKTEYKSTYKEYVLVKRGEYKRLISILRNM